MNHLKNLLKIIRNIIIIILCFPLLIVSIYGYARYEFRTLKVKELQLATNKVETSLRIVFLADFQYDVGPDKTQIQIDLLEKSVREANKQNPDLILLGGDYLNFATHTEQVATILGGLSAPYGVYGVLGNHDYEAKWHAGLVEQLAANGITMLENQQIDVAEISICGVEDYEMGMPDLTNCQTEANKLNILITHQPDYFETLSYDEKNQFDLTLAGHLHAGQITFFGLVSIEEVFPESFFHKFDIYSRVLPSDYGEKYRYGLKNYDDSYIYITSGLGGYIKEEAIRFGAKPEIVVIDVVRSEGKQTVL